MKALTYRTAAPSHHPLPTDKEFQEARRRLVGLRVQADVPTGAAAGYRKGIIREITRDRQALIECDGSFGSVWVSLENVAALEAVL